IKNEKLQNETSIDSNGFPVYRRRDLGNVVVMSGYLFKYINKGPDHATKSLVQNNAGNEDEVVDEVKAFYDCRYLFACEVAWRKFSFDVHYRFPSFTRLPFHLPGQQTVVFADEDDVEDILNKPTVGSSRFTDWMECNKNCAIAQTLTYAEFPTKFVWKQQEGFERYVRGPKCFEDIRTVDGEVCATYRDACYKRGLLDDDNEYIEAIEEASHTASDLLLSEGQLKNLALLEIQNFLVRNNCSLRCFPTMPFPDDDSITASTNRFMNEELSYDTQVMTGGVFFVYGYGETGKTFSWKTLSASIRSKAKIVLNVASSGIASLLLEGGRTAHSRFLIPINLTEDSTCLITKNPDICNLMKQTDLIIWDEAPMIHKHAFEALDRSLKDVLKFGNRNSCQHPFGGDFRQILPVVQNGSRSDIFNASLSSSHIWSKYKVLRLTKNMRLTVSCDPPIFEETAQFADWLLELVEGKLGGENDGNSSIEIPDDLLIGDSSDPLSDLIDFIYPALLDNFNQISYFQERAILAPLNEVVEDINDQFLSLFPGEEVEYLSLDSIDNSESVGPGFDPAFHSPDFLNGLKMPGMPNYKLILKVGIPIMLLRNIDQKNGLCNGTRLQVNQLGRRFIEVKVISGTNIGHRTYITRSTLTPTDKKLPIKLKQRQFPVSVCFAMTINKSQRQSLARFDDKSDGDDFDVNAAAKIRIHYPTWDFQEPKSDDTNQQAHRPKPDHQASLVQARPTREVKKPMRYMD
ncbi:uncharacterized protein LOC143578105, partial [Bidens hawaiensis]|uniref:uncharacterized protein LOC143578105 n=1 Tax=Bidens hawaiensis TaxID=980011 RepID=UPI00404A0D46